MFNTLRLGEGDHRQIAIVESPPHPIHYVERPSRPLPASGARAHQCTLCSRQRSSTHHRSREACAPRGLRIHPSHKMREAERRQAPLCERASNAGPRVPARSAFAVHARGTLASRRSTAAVFWPRARQGVAFGRCLTRRCPLAPAGAFTRSARSGGWAVSLGRLPGARLRAVHARRRIPLRLWLVSGDALGERDGTKIGAGKRASNYFGAMCIRLMIAAATTREFTRCHRGKLCTGCHTVFGAVSSRKRGIH